MALTASKTASCTIAPQRDWTNGFVGGADTVVCMIAFQSVTVSARTAETADVVSTIASVTAILRQRSERFIGLVPSFGLRYHERTLVPARRPSAGAMPGR